MITRRASVDDFAQPETGPRFRDLSELVEYRTYEGTFGDWFESSWLRPRLVGLGYTHVRFFGGRRSAEDGGFQQRVCEVRKGQGRVEYFLYG